MTSLGDEFCTQCRQRVAIFMSKPSEKYYVRCSRVYRMCVPCKRQYMLRIYYAVKTKENLIRQGKHGRLS